MWYWHLAALFIITIYTHGAAVTGMERGELKYFVDFLYSIGIKIYFGIYIVHRNGLCYICDRVR